MVRTGRRVDALRAIMRHLGHVEALKKPAAPRLEGFSERTTDQVMDLYRELGGVQTAPKLAPGSWDIAYSDGLVVELDEDMHFNRYRHTTLDAPWSLQLPWTKDYRGYCIRGEVHSGTGGRRWTNPSAEKMFGSADPEGVFDQRGGPRWKQRALYDSIKDAAAAAGYVRLARVSIYDLVDGQPLNEVLYGRGNVAPAAVAELVLRRTVSLARTGGMSFKPGTSTPVVASQ